MVVGPEQSGKTTITNLLAQVGFCQDVPSLRDLPYRPTAGVRIVEFETDLNGSGARKWGGERKIEVEVWDCSGNTKYESGWPATQKDADGVILVYNPENPNHTAEVETWYEWFIAKGGLKQEQCLVFANDRNSGQDDPRGKPPRALDDVELFYTDADDIDKFQSSFQDFVGGLGAFKK